MLPVIVKGTITLYMTKEFGLNGPIVYDINGLGGWPLKQEQLPKYLNGNYNGV
jgi:hypothetical protein